MKSPAIIGVAGTHSTGKTSFLREVFEALSNQGLKVGMIGDLGSSAKETGFSILRDHSFSSTLWIMTKGISLELESQLKNDVVLVDRPIPDALAYLYAALDSRSERSDPMERKYLEDLVRLNVPRYRILFKTILDETKPIDSSKPRDLDPVFRKSVDIHMTDIFEQLVQNWHRLESGKWDEAVAKCKSQVKQRGHRNT